MRGDDPLRHRHGQVHVLRHLRRVVPRTDASAPGDTEDTKCIRMTREFEAATSDFFPTLTFRFVRPGDAASPSSRSAARCPPRPSGARSPARSARRAEEYNRLAARWALDRLNRDDSDEAVNAPEVVKARVVELSPKVASAGEDPRKLEDLIYAESLAQTDCEACGYDTCRGYARGLLAGDADLGKCEPGGGRSKRDAELIFQNPTRRLEQGRDALRLAVRASTPGRDSCPPKPQSSRPRSSPRAPRQR